MSAHHPSARNSCNKSRTARKTAERKKRVELQTQHQPFMAMSRDSFFRIGKHIACEKKAIAFARSARDEDEGERKRKGAKKSTITIGIVKENKCIFAEGPNAKHFLAQAEFRFKT